MSFVFLNGKFVPAEEAAVSVFDQGFLYGDGIFESFRSIGGRLYQFSHHFARLQQSAQALVYPTTFRERELEKILLELREMNNLENAYYRVTVTRGTGEIGFRRAITNDLTFLIIAKEFRGFESSYYDEGIALHVARTRRNAPEAINPKIKSISNLNSLLGKLEAKDAGAFEVIMLNNRNHVCEGASSNIFWTRDNWVFTPDASTGLLEGVTRATIMRLCEEKMNLRVITGEYLLQDLKFSNEVFISSTSLEVMPVVKVDGFTINQGLVGPIARRLREELHRDMGIVP
ncbi:branched chain amino acid aminotransferase [Desulfuromonas versatilis]|uniref:branched-chain-amino-acid transaminase n=1 Tax=Desulfuromonas versatilis TaxID=2802975 RepID=A0ABM8HWK8_9BACT|nr:aminotransferase class IV [Desulfuromonas versatilis]BCR06319.1 branched chain amino acid aminotransferase [Desulfuromonas versatilis]